LFKPRDGQLYVWLRKKICTQVVLDELKTWPAKVFLNFLKLEFGPLAKKVGHPWFKPLIIHE
jgi:hypothetical protein